MTRTNADHDESTRIEPTGLPESGPVSGRFLLWVAVPFDGPCGRFEKIDTREFTVEAEELADFSADLADWAQERMRSRLVPLGVYLAECQIDAEDDGEETTVCLREQSFAWADLGEWPLAPWTHPRLAEGSHRS